MTSPDLGSLVHCSECRSPLAHDQRYCVQCGARRGPLPLSIAQILGAIHERGRRVASPARPPAVAPVEDPNWYDAWMRTPRAAAAAVVGMLGFGALTGAAVSGSAAQTLRPLIYAVVPSAISPESGSPFGSLGSGGGGGGGGSITETITSASPGTPGGSSGGGAGGGGSTTTGTTTTSTTPAGKLPPIKHVFVIALSQQGFQQTFGHPVNDPYLAKTLVADGELIPDYYAVAGGPLANEIALISGQGPTPDTISNCPQYVDVKPAGKGKNGQVTGNGCVYPKRTETLAGQLTAAKLSWKTYVQTPGTGKRAVRTACAYPKLGSADTALPTAKHPELTWRNPFLYFHSLIGKAKCPKQDVPLSQLATDLKATGTTPTLSYIVADACDDGADNACGDTQPTGLVAADKFLKSVVPLIKASPAYKADGLIAITFDDAPQSGASADSSSCCNEPARYPNMPSSGTGTSTTATSTTPTTTSTTTPTTTTATTTTSTTPALTVPTSTSTTPSTTPTTTTSTTPTSTTPAPVLGAGATSATGGGGQVGLLLISQYVKPATQDTFDTFNHFSLLASIEALFGLKPLGYASAPTPGPGTFGPSVYNNYASSGF